MKAIFKRRILALADFLENSVEEGRFEMRFWFSRGDRGIVVGACAYDDEEYLQKKDLALDGRYFPTATAARKSCGTAACIAGWLAMQHPRSIDLLRISETAGDYLGLDGISGDDLFVPRADLSDRVRFSKERAVRALRELAETGRVPHWWRWGE